MPRPMIVADGRFIRQAGILTRIIHAHGFVDT
jgi:hypothetical protein